VKLAIVGTGKMGRAVEAAAAARGHTVTTVVAGRENAQGKALTAERLAGAEVVVEFTRPDAVVANLERLADLGVPTVTGTTGWLEQLPQVTARIQAGKGALLHAANFSLGVQLLLRAAREMARALRGQPDFDATLLEWHHREKLDAPSGTALKLQEALAGEDPERIWPITSVRTGWIPGTHALEVDGRFETLSLVHTVRDRGVFADGAVAAAEWLRGRQGVYTFEDILSGGES